MSTLVDVHDEKGLEQFTWVIYDGVLPSGNLPELQGQHKWAQIFEGTYHLMYRGYRNSEHCPPCTSTSFDATQTARRATLQHRHAPLSRVAPPPRTARIPALQSTVNVLPTAASSYSAERATAAFLDHYSDEDSEEEDGPFHQFHAHRIQLGSPRKEAEAPPHQLV